MNLPFRASDKVLELGGGSNPANPGRWENLDCRWVPGVSIVADLNFPLPIPDREFDGVFSRYSLEHCSWRKVQQVVNEMHRVLRPGGKAVVITANLLEQCKTAIKWFEEGKGWEVSQMLFGDQDYIPGNVHMTGFSPEYAVRLFKEAGFYSVETMPLPECETDMTITAHKSKAVIS